MELCLASDRVWTVNPSFPSTFTAPVFPLEITGGKALACGEFIRCAQDGFRRVG